MKDLEFKKQIESMVIPFINDMLKKEDKHLTHLLKMQKKFESIKFFTYLSSTSKPNFENMIGKSKAVKSHLETRLKQYVEYSEKIIE